MDEDMIARMDEYALHQIMAEWTRKNEEQFGEHWPMAQIILGDLQDMGIHMLDPTPSNICFR